MWRIALAPLLICACCAHSKWARSDRAPIAQSDVQLASYDAEESPRTVYVLSNGFHTGLIVRKSDVPPAVWPEIDEIPDHPWVEVGWGSEIFYRAEKITAPVVMGAMVPNPSVLHVVGWDHPPEKMFAGGDLIRLEVDAKRFSEMCRFIHSSYVVDRNDQPQHLGPGIYGDGAFFRAKGKYYFPNTCNVWTARGLQHAGVSIVPELCSVADAVLIAARNAGTTVHRR